MNTPSPEPPDSQEASPEQPPPSRALHLVLVAVIAFSLIGFFVGIRQGTAPPLIVPPERPAVEVPGAIPATSYTEVDRRTIGPNRDWSSHLDDLTQPEIDLFATFDRDDTLRRAVHHARAARRAFDGAPPVVPHPIDQMHTASCMACHGSGLYIGKQQFAPAMSHEFMANCTQCHVEQTSPNLAAFTLAHNTFIGLEAAQGGERAWLGAPPTIPHTTFMRENCMSCHGPQGPDPIRTTHPWQTNCMQCHAPSATLNQVISQIQHTHPHGWSP